MDLGGLGLRLRHLLRDNAGQMTVIHVMTRMHQNQYILPTIVRGVREMRISVQVDRARFAVIGSRLPTADGLTQIACDRPGFPVSI